MKSKYLDQYEVTVYEDGQVWSKSSKMIGHWKDQYGYARVMVTKNGKRHNTSVHRLLAIAFIPNPENKPCVNHINSDKTDNRLENLEWVTHKENSVHAQKAGRYTTHAKRPLRERARLIMEGLASGKTRKELQEEFKITRHNLSYIINFNKAQ